MGSRSKGRVRHPHQATKPGRLPLWHPLGRRRQESMGYEDALMDLVAERRRDPESFRRAEQARTEALLSGRLKEEAPRVPRGERRTKLFRLAKKLARTVSGPRAVRHRYGMAKAMEQLRWGV